jgi:hypothetical protein
MARPITRIDEQQILVAIVVKIEKGHSSPHRLRQQLVTISPINVSECNAGSGRNVGEPSERNFLGGPS